MTVAIGIMLPAVATYGLLRFSDWLCPPGTVNFLLDI